MADGLSEVTQRRTEVRTVVFLNRQQGQKSIWLCMDIQMNACAYFAHTQIQTSLNILFTHFHSERKFL